MNMRRGVQCKRCGFCHLSCNVIIVIFVTFFGTWKEAHLAKVPVFKCQKWDFSCQNKKTTFNANIPLKRWITCLLWAFITFGRVLSQIWNFLSKCNWGGFIFWNHKVLVHISTSPSNHTTIGMYFLDFSSAQRNSSSNLHQSHQYNLQFTQQTNKCNKKYPHSKIAILKVQKQMQQLNGTTIIQLERTQVSWSPCYSSPNVIFVDLNADSVVILVQLAPSGVFQPQETVLEHPMPFFYICHFKIWDGKVGCVLCWWNGSQYSIRTAPTEERWNLLISFYSLPLVLIHIFDNSILYLC